MPEKIITFDDIYNATTEESSCSDKELFNESEPEQIIKSIEKKVRELVDVLVVTCVCQ